MTNLRNALLVTPLLLALVACNKKEEQQNAAVDEAPAVAEQTADAPDTAEETMDESGTDADAGEPASAEPAGAAPAPEDAAPAAEEKKGSALDGVYQGVVASLGGGTLVSQLAGNADGLKTMVGSALTTAGLDDAALGKVSEFLGGDTGKVFVEKASSLFGENAGLNAAGATPALLGKYFNADQVSGVSSFLGSEPGAKFFDALPGLRDTASKFIGDNTAIKVPGVGSALGAPKSLLEKAAGAASDAKDAAGDAAGSAMDAVKGMGGDAADAVKDAGSDALSPDAPKE